MPGKAKQGASSGKKSTGFTAEERSAMRERAKELRSASRPGTPEEADQAVLAKIDTMPEPDRSMGRQLHQLVRATAPTLVPRLWYGMPAYSKDGDVLCFFQPAHKFKVRYATLGFSDQAKLDEGAMWPTTYALTRWTDEEASRIVALLKRAIA